MLKRLYAFAGLTAVAVGLQFGLGTTSFAGGHGDCGCSHWYFWKHAKGPFGRDQICDTPCGTPFSCPPQGGYFGYFPTCWSRWPQDWQNCPVTDALPGNMAPCDIEMLPEADHYETDQSPMPQIAEPPLSAPPVIAPPSTAPPASSRKSSRKSAAASSHGNSPALVAPVTLRHFVTVAEVAPESVSISPIDNDALEPARLVQARQDTREGGSNSARPLENQMEPIRWEALEAAVAAEADAAEVVGKSSRKVDLRDIAGPSDVPIAIRRNPVRTRSLESSANRRTESKKLPLDKNVSREVVTVQAKLPLREFPNPLRRAPAYELGGKNPLRR